MCRITHADPRPQVLVVIADHLTLTDIANPHLPSFVRMRTRGAAALMSPGLAQGTSPILNVYASLGAGDAVRTGDKSQGLLARTLAAAGVRTALIGNGDSDEAGAYNPAALILPAPTPPPPGDGTRPAPTSPGGRRVDPARLWRITHSALADCAFVVVHDGDFARTERARDSLLPAAYAQHRALALRSLDGFLAFALAYADAHPACAVLFVVPTAPLHGQTWDSLTPFCRYAAHAPPSPAMQSATTQTWGLVASRDLAPTVLAALHIPAPVSMTGAPMEAAASIPAQAILPRLSRLDTLTRLNQDAQSPFFWTVGIVGGFVLLMGIALALSDAGARGQGARRTVRVGVRALSALPLALLLAPLAPAHALPAYYASIGGAIALLSLLPSPAAILSATALILIGDGLTGTHLVSQSLLSVYALAGIRFYGIGSEYLGVLLAGTLTLACSAWFASRPRWALALLFGLVVVVLSFPSFGAKAGGAVTATATFWAAWRALGGKPVTWRDIAAGVAAGFAIVLLWGVLGHWLPLRRTHIGTATDALSHARFGYIAGIMVRKMGFAVRVGLHPGTLAGLLGLGLAAVLAHRLGRARWAQFGAQNPRFAAVWRAGLWGGLVCVCFNDSGIVAAILLETSLALAGLHGLLVEPFSPPAPQQQRTIKGQ